MTDGSDTAPTTEPTQVAHTPEVTATAPVPEATAPVPEATPTVPAPETTQAEPAPETTATAPAPETTQAEPATEEETPATPIPVSAETLEMIADGAEDYLPITPIEGAALKSQKHQGFYMVAMRYQLPDGAEQTGVWALKTFESGPIISVDANAKEVTHWPDGAKSAFEISPVDTEGVETYVQGQELQEQQQGQAQQEQPAADNFTYPNCTAVREAGAAPIHPGDYGWQDRLDRDGDGVACDGD
ncbi:excalibur calcium-binding domain-containing protein [Arthrobacter sp. zg-Y820]|uniref:excalibur calcium-binding domain-containing protein n=1 Tax=unclassified Arthrobacter TaxID=235627 RepID=UPI001E48BD1F|nr:MULTISPECIES: excalibur calcium-binding domain-containing protein [unclassified Arthrobacter]MCC9195318.1 excalibur calcium-binding domain-containing protein [Arthrobacter sp. zg-Y820]MDK1278177.1 excalibur calcium-binding domain-containing protein [Arthrobacter sp. zg.Y820]WIB10063.1 excalibur calcium-binding domain-containing protein [Arthrobacter sp. zg-Y820]